MNPNTTSPHNPQNPFKLFLKVVLFLVFYLALCIALQGCKAKPIQNEHNTQSVISDKKDSIKTTLINGAINDTLKIQLPRVQTSKPQCDSITKAELQRVLQLLNSSKTSGDNQTGIYYDSLKNQIIAWQKIAQTQNEKIIIKKEYVYLKAEKKTEQIPIKYTPLWIKIFAFIGFATVLFIGYRISRIFI